MLIACHCFPQLNNIVWKKPGSGPITTKRKALKAIGQYLTRVKMIVKLVIEYTYGVRGSDKAVIKRNRCFEAIDVLNFFVI